MRADGAIILDILNLIGRFFKFGMETKQFPSPSMRRPVDVKHTLTFFFLRVSSHSAKPPPAVLPSALFVSDIRSVQGGCSRFSRCCYLIIDLSSHRFGESRAPGLSSQSPG